MNPPGPKGSKGKPAVPGAGFRHSAHRRPTNMSAKQLSERLDELKEKRKNGQIEPLEFYRGLLKLTCELMNELISEDISDENVKKQIPLVLSFLESQIIKFRERGG